MLHPYGPAFSIMHEKNKQVFSLLLTRFCLERLLYRISISYHADHFLPKGALLFDVWFDIPLSPTRDADFLGFGSSELAMTTGPNGDAGPDAKTNRRKRPMANQSFTFTLSNYVQCRFSPRPLFHEHEVHHPRVGSHHPSH